MLMKIKVVIENDRGVALSRPQAPRVCRNSRTKRFSGKLRHEPRLRQAVVRTLRPILAISQLLHDFDVDLRLAGEEFRGEDHIVWMDLSE